MTDVAPEVVKLLQQQMLNAVLAQAPLPGQSSRIFFPDLNLLLQQEEKVVSRENLVDTFETAVPVVFLPADEISPRLQQQKQFAFLKFRPAEILDDRVRLTLELHMGFHDVEPLPLGAVTATFAEVSGAGWQASEPPAALGY